MPDGSYLLAQANVARAKAPLDSPQLADFVAALDPVNRIAERAPGFVWRLRPDQRPTAEQALARLRHLRAYGPSARAFTLRRRFEPDGRPPARRSPAV